MKENEYFKKYWVGKTNAGHRYSNENFIHKLADERLYHIGRSQLLLDFGCGNCDLTKYYSEFSGKIIGADFTESMILQAKKEIKKNNINNIQLIQANEKNIWDLSLTYDCIISNQVIQYFNNDQLTLFIKTSLINLSDNGKLIFFDNIDPRIYPLYQRGIIKRINNQNCSKIKKSDFKYLFNCITFLKRKIKQIPPDDLGYSYHPCIFFKIAQENNLTVEFVCSKYYEYRYHVILMKEKMNGNLR